jgi:hypothetical protein
MLLLERLHYLRISVNEDTGLTALAGAAGKVAAASAGMGVASDEVGKSAEKTADKAQEVSDKREEQKSGRKWRVTFIQNGKTRRVVYTGATASDVKQKFNENSRKEDLQRTIKKVERYTEGMEVEAEDIETAEKEATEAEKEALGKEFKDDQEERITSGDSFTYEITYRDYGTEKEETMDIKAYDDADAKAQFRKTMDSKGVDGKVVKSKIKQEEGEA